MRKITEIQNGQYTAKVYRDTEYGEYRVRFYHAGSLLPECDAYETDEKSARGTAEMGLHHMLRETLTDKEFDDSGLLYEDIYDFI